MAKKFGKNREVDQHYFAVPIKYVLNYKGSNENSYDKYRDETYEEWKQGLLKTGLIDEKKLTETHYKEYLKYCEENNIDTRKILAKKGKEKILTIIDIYGKNALVAWRNSNTYKMGMTRLCPLIWKRGKLYLKYKDNMILLTNTGGWVI